MRGGAALLAMALMTAPALAQERVRIVPFETSAFPYRGDIPGGGPFLDVTDGTRRGHTSPRGGIYWETNTYSDRSVLLAVPRGFDPARPALIIVYFHGNAVQLDRDVVRRQGVARQLSASGLNGVLVAPQLAVNALDSSAGNFWLRGHFARFLDEAASHLATLSGAPREVFARAPVVVVAYSGGYLPAAFSLSVGGAGERVRGLVLLDALYGEIERFAGFIAGRGAAFVVSAYSPSTRDENLALQEQLRQRRIAFTHGLPERIGPGSVTFVDAGPNVVHNDFVTRAWVPDPLRSLLARIQGIGRR